MNKTRLASKLRLGFYVFGALVVIEVIEYAVGVSLKSGA